MAKGKKSIRAISEATVEAVKRSILFGQTGYKQPPAAHRFQQGRSGNPKGRPKSAIGNGSLSSNALVLKEASRLIQVRDGGEITQIPAIEAVHRAQYVAATKNGSAYAQKHIIERYARAERERRLEIEKSNEHWRDYIAHWKKEIAAAGGRGETPPEPLPHPDDVVIDRENGVRLPGPVNEEELANVETLCKVRDHLIKQDALDWREAKDPDGKDYPGDPGAALLFATLLNDRVPKRFQLSASEITVSMMRHSYIPKRQLLKDVYRGWRSLGAHPPRGKTFPPLKRGAEMADILFDLLARAQDGRIDVNGKPVEQLAEEIGAIIRDREMQKFA